MIRPDYARVDVRPVTVTRYQGQVRYVRHLAPGEDEVSYAACEHEHETIGAAERCAARMARKRTGDVR